MCGSGTLLAEAILRYCRIPSGGLRGRFGFRFLPDYDDAVWNRVRSEVDGTIRELPEGLIAGSDADAGAVAAARTNLGQLPGGKSVRVIRRRFEDITALENTTIVCNPPYGMRIGRREKMPEFVGRFGDFLKQRCTGSTAFVYFGKRELLKSVGLRTAWKRPLANGGLDGRLARYDLY
jgi:putative N6-adenine-specific DNA methylase